MNETLNHVVEQCPRTHAQRLARHENIANFIIRSLENHGYTMAKEPTFNLPSGNLKPDIIAISNNKDKALVIDVQVIKDSFNLDIAKLEQNPEI